MLAAEETRRYVELIERDGTYWEVLDHRGQNYVSPRWIMIGEESMLWSAIFLDVLRSRAVGPALLSPPKPIEAEIVAPTIDAPVDGELVAA